jgi:hypothetical protein
MSTDHDPTRLKSEKLAFLPKPKPQATLFITGDIRVQSHRPLPNPWVRFWSWALLGWKWKHYEEDKK